jgi:hypothetical protein
METGSNMDDYDGQPQMGHIPEYLHPVVAGQQPQPEASTSHVNIPSPESLQDLTSQLNYIRGQINQLQSQTHQRNRPPKEPRIADPEPFNGERGQLKNFTSKLQLKYFAEPSRFTTDEVKIAYAGALLRGNAYSWFRPLLTSNDDIIHDYELFQAALEQVFGDPDEVQTAERELRALRQTGSVATYVSNFRRIMSYLQWNNAALTSQFYIGLKDHVKDEFARTGKPIVLEDMMETSITIDNRYYDRQLEKKQEHPHSIVQRGLRPSTTTRPVREQNYPRRFGSSTTTPANVWDRNYGGPRPMELDAWRPKFKKLSDEEKKRRMDNKLCLYCGKPGHFSDKCPSRPKPQTNIGRVSQILQRQNITSAYTQYPINGRKGKDKEVRKESGESGNVEA